ncbi:hypothetical protein NP493_5166g00003 [Ridgeia piscesae]|uniref:EGF-like domain-containing protein n=1 Tax=Ridgeia piscesae TaxID=27915 RepID=A0AAD9IVD4_RIDPI|nr:hypothetical protein NP493_5166g00003 [Ridgeia piscesae]
MYVCLSVTLSLLPPSLPPPPLCRTREVQCSCVFVLVVCSVCQAGEWSEWGPCDTTCGGDQWRLRKICCAKSDTTAEVAVDDGTDRACLKDCGLTLGYHIERRTCRCIFGNYSATTGGCICDDHGYGNCCDYSECSLEDPCANEATCVNKKDHGVECFCQYGWTGQYCDRSTY